MDIQIVGYCVMLIFLGIVIFIEENKKSKVNTSVGNIGESIVANRLKALSEEFIVENDVHMGNVQIDHLAINHELQIIFVIETKMWGGTITGNRNDKYWLQDKNGIVKYLPNPIKQNEYHCHEARRYYNGYHIYNVVVFVRNKSIPRFRCIVDENGVIEFINKVSNKTKISILNLQ